MTIALDGSNGITFPSTSVQGDAGTGYGQTWQSVTGSRTSGTTYTNSTTKPIFVSISGQGNSTGGSITVVVAGVTIAITTYSTNFGGPPISTSFIVPVGATYVVTLVSITTAVWAELR